MNDELFDRAMAILVVGCTIFVIALACLIAAFTYEIVKNDGVGKSDIKITNKAE